MSRHPLPSTPDAVQRWHVFGANFRYYKERRAYSVPEIAQRSGVGRNTVESVMYGRGHKVSMWHLVALAGAVGWDPDEMAKMTDRYDEYLGLLVQGNRLIGGVVATMQHLTKEEQAEVLNVCVDLRVNGPVALAAAVYRRRKKRTVERAKQRAVGKRPKPKKAPKPKRGRIMTQETKDMFKLMTEAKKKVNDDKRFKKKLAPVEARIAKRLAAKQEAEKNGAL